MWTIKKRPNWRVVEDFAGSFAKEFLKRRTNRKAQHFSPLSSVKHQSRVFLLREVNTKFEIEWRGQRVALKASNGKYLCTKKNGQLSAVSDAVGRCPEGTNNSHGSASVGAAA